MTVWPEDKYAQVQGWSLVEASGPDAGKFLQSFCTNDVQRLSDGESCEAMFTDVKARVLAYGWVARRAAEHFEILLASDRAESLLEHLDRYLIREQVELKARLCDLVAIGKLDGGTLLPAFGTEVRVRLGEGSPPAGTSMAIEEFQELRIRLGVPFDGIDVDEQNLPQEVDRNQQAISFTKGCYLGQEPVARIDALGRVNWLLRGLEIEGSASTSEITSEGKVVGRITSKAVVGSGAVALGYLRREHAEPGNAVQVGGAKATVTGFPF